MSEKEGKARQPAGGNAEGRKAAGDAPSRTGPGQPQPSEREPTTQELKLCYTISELVLGGFRHVGSVNLLALYDLAGIRLSDEKPRQEPVAPPAEQNPGDTASAMRPSPFESADALRFLYPSLSRGMLAYMNGIRDRVVAERTAPGSLPYPGIQERTALSAEETAKFPKVNPEPPDGVVAGDLFNHPIDHPTRYVPASGSDMEPVLSSLPTIPMRPVAPLRSIDELAAQDAQTTNMQPVEKPPHPASESDTLGNPPVEFFRPIELPPKT